MENKILHNTDIECMKFEKSVFESMRYLDNISSRHSYNIMFEFETIIHFL